MYRQVCVGAPTIVNECIQKCMDTVMQGWKFTAAQPELSPHVFWGLRRPAITELDEARRNMLWHPVLHGLRQNRIDAV